MNNSNDHRQKQQNEEDGKSNGELCDAHREDELKQMQKHFLKSNRKQKRAELFIVITI